MPCRDSLLIFCDMRIADPQQGEAGGPEEIFGREWRDHRAPEFLDIRAGHRLGVDQDQILEGRRVIVLFGFAQPFDVRCVLRHIPFLLL